MRRGKGRSRNVVVHVDMAQRRNNRRMQARLLAGALSLGLAGLAVFAVKWTWDRVVREALTSNPDFAIREITVEHLGSLRRSEILVWAGVREGDNLMAVDLAGVRRRLLDMPYVAEARVERRLPSTLVLAVAERMPVAQIMPYSAKGNRPGMGVVYVDADGFVMRPKQGEKLKPLPVIIGVEQEDLEVGRRTERREIISTLTLLRAAEHYGLKAALDLTQISVQRKGCLLVRTQMQQGLITFRADFLDLQIKRLLCILEDAKQRQRKVRTVDLTPDRNVPVTFF